VTAASSSDVRGGGRGGVWGGERGGQVGSGLSLQEVCQGLARSVWSVKSARSVKVCLVCQAVWSVKSGLSRSVKHSGRSRSVKVCQVCQVWSVKVWSADCLTGPDRTMTWAGPDLTLTRPCRPDLSVCDREVPESPSGARGAAQRRQQSASLKVEGGSVTVLF
jgi:hypothetical protein